MRSSCCDEADRLATRGGQPAVQKSGMFVKDHPAEREARSGRGGRGPAGVGEGERGEAFVRPTPIWSGGAREREREISCPSPLHSTADTASDSEGGKSRVERGGGGRQTTTGHNSCPFTNNCHRFEICQSLKTTHTHAHTVPQGLGGVCVCV